MVLPPLLAAELTRLSGTPAGLDGFDAAGAAGVHFARVRRNRRLRWGSVAAAAASLAMGVFVIAPWGESRSGRSRMATEVATEVVGDLNGDGTVNMLDALMLATRVDAGEAMAAWDFNHDNMVDRRDADVLAMVAVDLKGGRL